MPRTKEAVIGQRARNLFDPTSAKPYKLSRSKLELFLRCARCFYLDRRLGIGQPSIPPYTLNNAVDQLLKREFDFHRREKSPHPLMTEFGIDAVPFSHPLLETWRENFQGIQVLHEQTRFLFTGAIDDVWVDPEENLLVVDYKATSTVKEISLDDEWKAAYKRQMEMYQWLLRGQGLQVSDVGYFVFVNADASKEHFAGKLEFVAKIIPYIGDDSWVEDALLDAHHCLCRDTLPPSARECEWCGYRKAAMTFENSSLTERGS